MKSSLKFAVAAILVASPLSGCGLADINRQADSAADPMGGPQLDSVDSRVAIVFDRSGSFVQYLPSAVKVVQRYIRENGISGSSEILLIGMGQRPEFIKRFRAGTFMDKNGRAMLDALRDPLPGTGTDVVSSLEMAARRLRENSVSNADHLFCLVFSDMNVDPHKSGANVTSYRPLDVMDWSLLKGVSTSFYFVDPSLHDRMLALGGGSGQNWRVFDPNDVDTKDVSQATETN